MNDRITRLGGWRDDEQPHGPFRPQDRTRVRPMYVIVTETVRCYGGPEEGGWWYDRRYVEEVRRAFDWRGLRHVLRELAEDYPLPRFNRFSAAGHSDFDFWVTDDPVDADRLHSPNRQTYE